eukprot:jgi/Mesvir1/23222/Mv22679-RA.1
MTVLPRGVKGLFKLSSTLAASVARQGASSCSFAASSLLPGAINAPPTAVQTAVAGNGVFSRFRAITQNDGLFTAGRRFFASRSSVWDVTNKAAPPALQTASNGTPAGLLERPAPRRMTDKLGLWRGKPVKHLTVAKTRTDGRNCHGRITVYHRGGGHKRRIRLVDFHRRDFGREAVVERFEYDPNRSVPLALIRYLDNAEPSLAYILKPEKLKAGDHVVSSRELVDLRPGNAMPLRVIPVGTAVHNVELIPGRGGQLVRAGGGQAQLVERLEGQRYCLLKLRSGEIRRVLTDCMATVGVLEAYPEEIIGKAGRNRWLGKRPVVRGTAMNPVDHPHGGGEGKSKGNHPMTPWGRPTKGYITRKRNKPSNRLIATSRHKSK